MEMRLGLLARPEAQQQDSRPSVSGQQSQSQSHQRPPSSAGAHTPGYTGGPPSVGGNQGDFMMSPFGGGPQGAGHGSPSKMAGTPGGGFAWQDKGMF